MADLIAATFADLYPGFGERGRTLAQPTEALATSDEALPDLALFQHTARALESLDDAHVSLAATIDGTDHDIEGARQSRSAARANGLLGVDAAERERNWSRAYREDITGLLEGSGHQVTNRHILSRQTSTHQHKTYGHPHL